MNYMVIKGLEDPSKAEIVKCSKTKGNLIFNNLGDADDLVEEIEASSEETKARVVAV
ncbi:hypothetical protein tloyanaT_13180 [Thalassotalea loyana]|uniref:Uncharacterized protein n=1 Tax=Thalassotalea loyana TaxID=280483 RepID=A0ABQ6HDV3_9GAMM|nr:hypothetical protein [Thalassotalea loyana]GLX85066.1 hypothetical protein tloyanaT_13180 [Thalassotalea loyana]